jgi:hypothetical protein
MKSGFAARIIIEPDFTCFLMLRKKLTKTVFFSLVDLDNFYSDSDPAFYFVPDLATRIHILHRCPKNVLFCSKEEN